VLHAALDALDDAAWHSAQRGDCHLRAVDRFNALCVSAYVTPGGARMLLLHDGRPQDESVRSFFLEVHDAYVRAAANPMQAPGARLIPARAFEARVRAAARRALGAPAVVA
jgi:trafficking protein particle complex subunit 2